ncbi:MAG: class I SAM-dependent methyltransferase [Kordiimonadaceae bacterium]|nr:class I SAM-dependent methyltransferase [Kordiimonadaceae bacterium]MBO6569956.1 class I SAM-dependent methyltransferase [Kordiimonadaceae bacterium]MBO6965947.1 class I SAM-dependent methyltransferase [Kordiimonadaceae bacterium]
MRHLPKVVFALLAFSISSQADERPTATAEVVTQLEALIANPERPDRHVARDQYRHPLETLTFMGIKPTETVVEIFPGGQGGWYRRIIEPLIEQGGGDYHPVRGRAGWPENTAEGVPYGEVDMVFVFRVHGFLIYGAPAEDHVSDIFRMLKPGGYFGIVDHAEREDVEQDPVSQNGYVKESYFRAMAEAAGFELVRTSDVNRNPGDTKEHPMGVYSLPPSLRGPNKDEHRAVGESDRFTHLYRKPS